MSLLINVKKRGKSRLFHCSQMSRKEGNPGYVIAHKSQKEEKTGYVIAHKCQEKREIQITPLLTNVKKEGNRGFAIAHKCEPKREIQITVIAHKCQEKREIQVTECIFLFIHKIYALDTHCRRLNLETLTMSSHNTWYMTQKKNNNHHATFNEGR